ncbi:hypothetical protein VNO78_22895 [Psophocarpus tetragonolobus]|uniref:Uncharacterized protein n=1 Tax=Psophocarpus tetragonolobus TaxID=3891 RepID=A0AAN9S2C9_PSOTE
MKKQLLRIVGASVHVNVNVINDYPVFKCNEEKHFEVVLISIWGIHTKKFPSKSSTRVATLLACGPHDAIKGPYETSSYEGHKEKRGKQQGTRARRSKTKVRATSSLSNQRQPRALEYIEKDCVVHRIIGR